MSRKTKSQSGKINPNLIKTRDLVHLGEILHGSGTGTHKSKKKKSRQQQKLQDRIDYNS